MSEVIEAGLLSNLLKSVGNSFRKSISNWGDNIVLQKQEELKGQDGSPKGSLTTIDYKDNNDGEHIIKIKLVPTSGRTGLYDVYILDNEKNKEAHMAQRVEDFKVATKLLNQFAVKYYGDEELSDGKLESMAQQKQQEQEDEEFRTSDLDIEEEFKDFDSSKKIQFGLQKIQGSKEIKLTCVYANYDSTEALNALNDVLEDEELRNEISEEEQFYTLTDTADDYILDPLPALPEPAVDYQQDIMESQMVLMLMLESACQSFLHLYQYESAISMIRAQHDFMLRYHSGGYVLLNNVVANFPIDSEPGIEYTSEEWCELLTTCTINYIDTLYLNYSNFDPAMQTLIDNWILDLKVIANELGLGIDVI